MAGTDRAIRGLIMRRILMAASSVFLLLAACSEEPEGLGPAQEAAVTVRMDFFDKPLPTIPLPNDIATRYDATSPTGRRINASFIAPTGMEASVREKIGQIDGWGTLMPITIPFTGPIDPMSIREHHNDPFYDTADDVIYLIDVDRDSPDFGELQILDVGNGNYPVVLERQDYWEHDPRNGTISLAFEEVEEDLNGNGVLDPGEDVNRNGALDPGEDLNGNGLLDPPEDTDADGLLDHPNYYPGANPDPNNLAERSDALMTFYEIETDTLIVRPMVPLRERTTYAVVVTRRILDTEGNPIGSPYASINHTSQTEALMPLKEVLPEGLALSDIAFAYSFTTETTISDWVAVRNGLYGTGPQAHLSTEFPPVFHELLEVRGSNFFRNMQNPYILHGEAWSEALSVLGPTLLSNGPNRFVDELVASQDFVDFHSMMQFKSPQLYNIYDENGDELPLNDMSWPEDLTINPAPARAEDVFTWLVVPRKEVSARGNGEPAPLVILGHGYGSNRFELAYFSGFLARSGYAVAAIDCPSHGLDFSEDELSAVEGLLPLYGLEEFGSHAVNSDRARDQNADGNKDSGADFWTAYLFRTRDIVRQCLLDYTQLVRILREFDGTNTWDFDVDGDGTNDLAGDFDGDGNLDISGVHAPLLVTGGSLGGIMATLLGGTEPEIDAIAPIAGGGGLGDIGIRSVQGGVREAVVLRLLAPLMIGTTDAETGTTKIYTLVAELADDARRDVAEVSGVLPGDTVVVTNIDNNERGCAYVTAAGTFRAAAASDRGDRQRIDFYRGPSLITGSEDCEVVEGAEPYETVDRFQWDFDFMGEPFTANQPLVALEEGLALRRSNPELRRFLALGQMVLDRADPATYAPYLVHDTITYDDGSQTGAPSMIITTMGDMNVPASSGVTVGRAARIIDFINEDERYGVPANQMLIDTYTSEAVHRYKRYTFNDDPNAAGVHLDIENFSLGADEWGASIPRLEPASHLVTNTLPDGRELDAWSGALFPYPVPEGQHGFPFPGESQDASQKHCEQACPEAGTCDCENAPAFDIGWFMFNMIGAWFENPTERPSFDQCFATNDCPGAPVAPPRRTNFRALP